MCPTSCGEVCTRGALLAGEGDDPCGDALTTLLAEEMRDVLLCLGDREALVIRKRFGIGCARRHTLAEIGEELGLSRERVRQLENHALDTLRSPGLRRRLAAYAEER